MDGDEHLVGLLTEGVPGDQPLRGEPCTVLVRGGESSAGHERQGILEPVGQPFAFGGEAVVTEALSEVAGVQR